MQRRIIANEIINLFCDINHNCNRTQQENREEERHEKLFDDIPVECFQELDEQLTMNNYNLLDNFGTISFFHAVKVPSFILFRASVTSHR